MTTSPMRSTATAPSHADGLRVRCTLPEALTLSRHRNDFRAVLARPLKVDVCLRSADATEYNGRLCNLSVGGGLMRVPQENAGELKTCRVACRLRMRFPSGDVLDADCRVRRAYRPSESRFIYVAFVFAADVIDQNRRGVWFYVREIEREVTRLTRACNNMRALAPSPLFADSPNTAPRPRPVAAAQSG